MWVGVRVRVGVLVQASGNPEHCFRSWLLRVQKMVQPGWAVREVEGGKLTAHLHYLCMTEGAERGHLRSPSLYHVFEMNVCLLWRSENLCP